MAWIKTINEDNATDYLKTYYKKYGDPFDGVDNVLKVQSLNPHALKFHYDLFKHLMTGKSNLSRMQREMIAIVVSAANKCEYCLRHHKKRLHQLTKNPFLIGAIEGDFYEADVPEKDIAMMAYSKKLTTEPNSMTRSDVSALREAGFKDVDILDIAQIVAYHNFVNRLASGLGVKLEGYWKNE